MDGAKYAEETTRLTGQPTTQLGNASEIGSGLCACAALPRRCLTLTRIGHSSSGSLAGRGHHGFLPVIDYSNDFLAFRRDMCPVEGEYGPEPVIPDWLEHWYSSAFPYGDPAARTIMDCRTKKQGKSADGAAVALYMAARQPYGEVVIAASDKDQAKDRVLRACKFAVENGPLRKHAKVLRSVIEFDNGSEIQALPYDWKGSSGGNYRCIVFDELHAWTLENQRRMFDELIVPPTISNGCRWIASYAGWLGESELLKEWWDLALGGEMINGYFGENAPPIYHVPDASLLALIDVGEESWRHEWVTPEYIEQVRATERPNTFKRLWLNAWMSNEDQFVTSDQWAACYEDYTPGGLRMVLGADASTSRDLTALVGVSRSEGIAMVEYVRTWKPVGGDLRSGKPTVDLSGIDAEVRRLHKAGLVNCVVFDPYQLHSLASEWTRSGIRCIEMPQTAKRTEADQQLYDAIISKTLVHFNHPMLNEHVQHAVARETPRGFRLDKDRTSLKIDAAVALSMAHHGATDGSLGPPILMLS